MIITFTKYNWKIEIIGLSDWGRSDFGDMECPRSGLQLMLARV